MSTCSNLPQQQKLPCLGRGGGQLVIFPSHPPSSPQSLPPLSSPSFFPFPLPLLPPPPPISTTLPYLGRCVVEAARLRGATGNPPPLPPIPPLPSLPLPLPFLTLVDVWWRLGCVARLERGQPREVGVVRRRRQQHGVVGVVQRGAGQLQCLGRTGRTEMI